MNATTGGAPFVGVAAAGEVFVGKPLTLPAKDIVISAKENSGDDDTTNPILGLNTEQHRVLLEHLMSRINAGAMVRDNRLKRMTTIDRTISTWQKLDPTESKLEAAEENTGKSKALPLNLPILAAHLNDMVSYFSEALAPVSNPFFSASGEGSVKELLNKMNRDAIARDYFSELNLTLRSLLKYNLGGFWVTWEDTQNSESSAYSSDQSGNLTKSADLYNTFWDTTIRDPREVCKSAEWAAYVCVENRLTLMRRALTGEWVRIEDLLESESSSIAQCRYYKEPSFAAALAEDGMDARTSQGSATSAIDWNAYGVGYASDLGKEVSGFEVIYEYCWLFPAKFGLLTNGEKQAFDSVNINPDTFLELWQFVIVNNDRVVLGRPVNSREQNLAGEKAMIPLYLAHMTQDQLKQAQRSMMELIKGFQRFGSAMMNIYIAGMRKNVWGIKAVDPSMFDSTVLQSGETVGVMNSKIAGRDVRSGVLALDQTTGVEKSMDGVNISMELKDKLFPAQALPANIAGIDRAIKSQVATVVQGGQRSLRTLLRLLDSALLVPVRLGLYRNLKRYDNSGIENIGDDAVAKLLGSGIESMEAERIVECLWQLLYAIIQNQEAMQTFNVPLILTYIGRLSAMSIDLGMFVRQPQNPTGAPPAPVPAGAAPAA